MFLDFLGLLSYLYSSQGHSGGIWILSSSNDLSFHLVENSIQAITLSISKGNAKWFVSTVYASLVFSVRSNLWDQLIALRSNINGPWLVIGDLNEVVYSSEVSGSSFSHLEQPC